MKKIFYYLFLLLGCFANCFAGETSINNETTLTLHVATPGTLSDLIFDAGTRPINVAKLTLTGTLNDDDFTCMRETMTSLQDVDLSRITNTSGVNFKSKSGLKKLILPNNLTSIGNSAFYRCTSLTSITIPNSVTSIGGSAFSDCSKLTSITIPKSVRSIGTYAFYDCSSLTSITIPNRVTSIGEAAFSGCTSLTSITIPNSVTRIEDDAFRRCSSLTSVTIGNSAESIGAYAFFSCSSLTSITIPNSVTSIGDDAFGYCSSLTSITIPNSVTSIGEDAFYRCYSLTSITIPNSVTSIGDEAFWDCSKLTSITCLPNTPPTVSDIGANTTSCKLLVPKSAYKDYILHKYWGQFLDLVYGYEVTLSTNNDQWGEVTGAGIYTQEATITATPNEGYTFLRWSDGNTDNPRTIQVTSDTTLTAEFAIEGDCLVTFVDWDGTMLSSVSVALGEAATAPADPTREGYTFIGWDKDFSAVTDHMTVTAQYKQIVTPPTPESITVRLDPQSCSSWSNVYLYAWDAGNTPIAGSWPGTEVGKDADGWWSYTFAENVTSANIIWNNGSGAQTIDIKNVTASTYYKLNTQSGYKIQVTIVDCSEDVTPIYYTVAFKDWDGTTLKTEQVEQGKSATAPTDPIREGYTFIGWDQAFDSITSDLDVYAMYEMGEDRDMTIVFTNGNDDSEVLSQSITIKIPAAPEIAGFTFLYWQPVAEPLTDVITIQAIYEANAPASAPEVYINPANPAQKLLRNGQVYILKDDKTYTIMGAEIQ